MFWKVFLDSLDLFSHLVSPVFSSLPAGSYDNKILMWDIGGVDSQYNYKVV